MSPWQFFRKFFYLSAAAGVLLVSQPGHAAVASGPFGLQGGIVSDAELAGIRGRFVNGRNVTFFGIEMRTNWFQHGGHDFNMEMHLNIDLAHGRGRFKPRVTMYHTRNLGEVNTQNSGAGELDNVSDNGALENISGVVQNIQVAGDSNAVHNDVQWSVTDSSSEGGVEGLVELGASGTQSYTNDDGVITQVFVDSDGVGYQVYVPEVGIVSQRITRAQLSGGSILQSTQLDSNLNQVLNQIGLRVELSPATSIATSGRGFNRTLGNLMGL